MTRLRRISVLVTASVVCLALHQAVGEEVVLTIPGYDYINAYGLDQPELSAVLTDGGSVITEGGSPVIIEVFVDTGASGTAISYLNAEGYDYEPFPGFGFVHVPSLGLDGVPAGEFTGTFLETGIGGTELGNVTRDFGVKILNGPMGGSGDPADFVDYGQHSLWVRMAPGVGEIVEVLGMTLVDPVNVVGMPVIHQRVMVMDPTPLVAQDRLATHLLPPGDGGIPQTNVTFDLHLVDMTGLAPEEDPSHFDNPLVRHVTLTHDDGGGPASVSDSEFLFDTGSSATFISFAHAQAVGMIDAGYADLAAYLPDHIAADGITGEVGGIGGSVTVPLLELDEFRIAAKEGFDVVWQNVDVLVIDITAPGSGGLLDGAIGMNLFVPAVTIDPADPLGGLEDISPGYFDAIVFDATDVNNAELRVYCELVPKRGDANLDDCVDGLDYIAWSNNYLTGTEWGQGDFVDDDMVDGLDYIVWSNNYEGSCPAAPSVPEPGSGLLAALAGLALIRRRRARRLSH